MGAPPPNPSKQTEKMQKKPEILKNKGTTKTARGNRKNILQQSETAKVTGAMSGRTKEMPNMWETTPQTQQTQTEKV